MPNENFQQSETLFGQKMLEKMEGQTPVLSIKDVADKAGSTYEYIRKLVRGQALPSKYMLRTLCQVLDLDLKEMERLRAADTIRKEHGTIPFELAGKNPELEMFERGWPQLTDKQKTLLRDQLKEFTAQNRKHHLGSAPKVPEVKARKRG